MIQLVDSLTPGEPMNWTWVQSLQARVIQQGWRENGSWGGGVEWGGKCGNLEKSNLTNPKKWLKSLLMKRTTFTLTSSAYFFNCWAFQSVVWIRSCCTRANTSFLMKSVRLWTNGLFLIFDGIFLRTLKRTGIKFTHGTRDLRNVPSPATLSNMEAIFVVWKSPGCTAISWPRFVCPADLLKIECAGWVFEFSRWRPLGHGHWRICWNLSRRIRKRESTFIKNSSLHLCNMKG